MFICCASMLVWISKHQDVCLRIAWWCCSFVLDFEVKMSRVARSSQVQRTEQICKRDCPLEQSWQEQLACPGKRSVHLDLIFLQCFLFFVAQVSDWFGQTYQFQVLRGSKILRHWLCLFLHGWSTDGSKMVSFNNSPIPQFQELQIWVGHTLSDQRYIKSSFICDATNTDIESMLVKSANKKLQL